MFHRMFICVATLVLATNATTSFASVLYTQDFSGTTGTDPANWVDSSGAFAIDGAHEYRATTTGGITATYNQNNAIATWTDYQIDLNLRWGFSGTGPGAANSWVGIGGRHLGGSAAYYHFGINLGGQAIIQKFGDGAAILDSVAVSLPQGQDYLVRYRFAGDDITAMLTSASDINFDSPLVSLSATDASATKNSSGGLALRAVASGTVTIVVDDITVTTIPEPASLGLLGLGSLLIAGRRTRA